MEVCFGERSFGMGMENCFSIPTRTSPKMELFIFLRAISMKIECSKCGSIYQVKASKIPDKGAYAKCKKCQNRIFVKRQSEKRNEKIDAIKNKPQLREPNVNNQERIAQKPADIVCSKCGQRQPSSNDTCFKCGFNLNKKDRKTGKTPSIHGLIKKALCAQNQKKIKIPVAGFIAAGLICVFGDGLRDVPWLRDVP